MIIVLGATHVGHFDSWFIAIQGIWSQNYLQDDETGWISFLFLAYQLLESTIKRPISSNHIYSVWFLQQNDKMTSYLDAHTNSYDRTVNSSPALSTTVTPKTPIDYRIKANHNLAPQFVFECAIKLNMKPLTSATAAIILHRFNCEVESENYDDFVSKWHSANLFVSVLIDWFQFSSWLPPPHCIWPENSKTTLLKFETSSM